MRTALQLDLAGAGAVLAGRSGSADALGAVSDAALGRVAAWGDGWYGFNLDGVTEVAERLAHLDARCREAGREAGRPRVAVALRRPHVDDVGPWPTSAWTSWCSSRPRPPTPVRLRRGCPPSPTVG